MQNRQSAALTATERELHKMRVRMQTMSRDIQPALRQARSTSCFWLGTNLVWTWDLMCLQPAGASRERSAC